jgi:hypothetical protein
VDGDVKDGKEWFEGPVPDYKTIRELFEMKDKMDRGARREVYGRMKLGDDDHSNLLTGNECGYDEREESLDGDDMVAVHAVGAGSANGVSSEDADENASCDSSSAAPRSSTGTRRRASREISAKRAKTCPDAGNRALRTAEEAKAKTCAVVQKPKAGGMDLQDPDFLKLETKSAAKEGVELSERKG